VRDERGSFLGVARVIEGASRIRPERIFHADRSGTRVLPA
jgi:hypothetical protein